MDEELEQDNDIRYVTKVNKLPGIKNAIRRLFCRGGYEYETTAIVIDTVCKFDDGFTASIKQSE